MKKFNATPSQCVSWVTQDLWLSKKKLLATKAALLLVFCTTNSTGNTGGSGASAQQGKVGFNGVKFVIIRGWSRQVESGIKHMILLSSLRRLWWSLGKWQMKHKMMLFTAQSMRWAGETNDDVLRGKRWSKAGTISLNTWNDNFCM